MFQTHASADAVKARTDTLFDLAGQALQGLSLIHISEPTRPY